MTDKPEPAPEQTKPAGSKRKIEMEECKKHVTEQDCWVVISGKVYDVTNFLDEHPGGFDIILSATGKDATEEFEEIGHSTAAREMLDQYEVGEFEGGPAAAASVNAAASKAAHSAQQQQQLHRGPLKAILPLLPIIVLVLAVLLGIRFIRKE